MKKFLLLAATAWALTSTAAFAQQQAPNQVGLIDMAYVFKNYQKFTAMTESLQKEIEQSDSQAKAMIEQLKQIQDQLTSGNLQAGSADYVKLENQMLDVQTKVQTFRQVAQRDFLRKEADLYKTIYLETEDAVNRYAQYYHYTLVLRFNRQKVDEAENPQEIINGMNRQVIYFRPQDDLTDPILDFLNDQWRQKQTAGGNSAPATR